MLSSKSQTGTTGAATAARATAPRAPGQKKSCDLCVFRKRKCDGVMPSCGFCLSRGSECHYSLRRPNRPRGYARRTNEGEQQVIVKTEEKLQPGNRSGEEESFEMQQRQQDAPLLCVKRTCLSASPATGLVGTKENAFLGSFFNCLGFLSMTHERLIRAALMKVWLASPSGAEILDQGSVESGNTAKAENYSRALDGNEERDGADAACVCALWCSIAMGALVQGQPPEQVISYMNLARTSLSQCFDTITVESGRAFLMMAFLHNFMQNDHEFFRYLQQAGKIVKSLPENTAQKQKIDDLVMMGNDTRIFHTAALEASELDAYCTNESPALEVPGTVHKSNLCQLLLRADRRLMKAFLRDHKAHAASPLEVRKRHVSASEEYQRLEKRASEGIHAERSKQGVLSGVCIKTDGASIASTRIDEETRPSRPGVEIWKWTEETRQIFARLEEAVEAPKIRGGVGILLYNSMSRYVDMVTGATDLDAGFEKTRRCAEIISRYPGLCRFSAWRHLSHGLLSILAKLGDVGLFEELRQAYNSVRHGNAPEVPPHAEWTMVGFCDHIFCRSTDNLDKSWSVLTATQTFGGGDGGERRWMSEEPHCLDDTDENNTHWASLAPEYHSGAAIPGQRFPMYEWTDVMLPFPAETSSVIAQHVEHMVPAPGPSAVGPLSTTGVSPVWSTPGHRPSMTPSESTYERSPAWMHPCADGQIHTGWQLSASIAAANAAWTYHRAGAMWPSFPSATGPSCGRMTASPAQLVFGEKAVHNAAVGIEGELRRTSGRSTSEMGGAGGDNDRTLEGSVDPLEWLADAAPSEFAGVMLNGQP